MPKKREHVTSERGVQHGRLSMGATRNHVAGKSNQQRFEGCPSRMPSGCTKYSGCRWVGSKKERRECERRQESALAKNDVSFVCTVFAHGEIIVSLRNLILR